MNYAARLLQHRAAPFAEIVLLRHFCPGVFPFFFSFISKQDFAFPMREPRYERNPIRTQAVSLDVLADIRLSPDSL